MSFEMAFSHTVGLEGRYSDNPSDSGGPTMFGITEAVARENGYQGAMRALPLDTAKEIYRARYWDKLALTSIYARSPVIACALFDIAVNCGTGEAGRFLQRALNAFNRQAKDYADIAVDGAVGGRTLSAFRAFLDRRGRDGIKALTRAINCQHGAYYLDLAGAHPVDEDFMFGWFLNRVGG